jgi:hypothetical protein
MMCVDTFLCKILDFRVQTFSNSSEINPESLITSLFKTKPHHSHLDVLSKILTQSSALDERVTSFIAEA